MFGRRVPPHIVFALSLMLAVACAAGAVATFGAGRTFWTVLLAVLAVWFAVDAFRSFSWAQAKKRLDAEKAAQNGHR